MPSCRGKNLELLESDRTKRPSCQYKGLLLRKSQTQVVYAQHTAQKPGLGFPIARVVALLHLGTGCLLDAAIGPYQGKDTSEIAMLRHLLSSLKAGDVVVADRHFCSYWLIALLMQKGVHVCFRKHQARHTDFRKGRRLGKNDHIVTWKRGSRPNCVLPNLK